MSGSSVKLAGGPRGAGRLRTGCASSVPAGRPAESATSNLTQRFVGSRDCVLPPAPTRHVHSVHTRVCPVFCVIARDICSIFAGAGQGACAVATLWPESTDRREALLLSEPTKQVESVLPETRMGHCDGCDDSRARFSHCSSCCRQATDLCDCFMELRLVCCGVSRPTLQLREWVVRQLQVHVLTAVPSKVHCKPTPQASTGRPSQGGTLSLS